MAWHSPSRRARVQQGAAWTQMGLWKEGGALESDRKRVRRASPRGALPCVVWGQAQTCRGCRGPAAPPARVPTSRRLRCLDCPSVAARPSGCSRLVLTGTGRGPGSPRPRLQKLREGR